MTKTRLSKSVKQQGNQFPLRSTAMDNEPLLMIRRCRMTGQEVFMPWTGAESKDEIERMARFLDLSIEEITRRLLAGEVLYTNAFQRSCKFAKKGNGI
jgi:hypothetical protein